MKKLNALLLTTALALGAAAPAVAQPGDGHYDRGSHGEKAERKAKKLHRMLKKVGASDEQKQVIEAILAAEQPAKQALKARGKALREKMQALDPMSGDYSNRVAELAAERAGIARDGFTQKALVKQKIALQLTPEQRAKWAEIKADRKQRRAEMAGLSKEQRKELREAKRAEKHERRKIFRGP